MMCGSHLIVIHLCFSPMSCNKRAASHFLRDHIELREGENSLKLVFSAAFAFVGAPSFCSKVSVRILPAIFP